MSPTRSARYGLFLSLSIGLNVMKSVQKRPNQSKQRVRSTLVWTSSETM